MDALKLVLGGLGMVYVVSPVDLLPEAVLGPLGLVDDAYVFWISGGLILSGLGREDIAEEVQK